MDFSPEHYFQTATQRIRQAHLLYENNQDGTNYALAIYVGGVAVECMLRAFKGRRDPIFDEKHHLLRLFHASGMLQVDPEKLRALNYTDDQIEEHRRSLQIAVNVIFDLWSNNYRFASEERLNSHLKKVTRYQKIKGNYLKEQARLFLHSARKFIDKGVMLWQF